MLSIPASAVAVVLGHMARYRIRRSNGKEQGALLALAGLVVGYVTFAGSITFLGFLAVSFYSKVKEAAAEREAPQAAEAALSQAEAKILTATHGKGQGNTPEARAMAEKFATLMEDVHGEAFTKTRAKLKFSGGHYVTWCERHEGTCAFVVHVPEYRRFTSDAKETLNELAWTAAQLTTDGELQPGERVAVGLRGVVLYGSVMLGSADSDGTLRPDHSTGTDGSDLHPFFDADRALPADDESPDDSIAAAPSLPSDPLSPESDSGSSTAVRSPPDVGTPTAEASKISDHPAIAETVPEANAGSEEHDDSRTRANPPASGATTNRPARRFSMPESTAAALALLDSEDRLTRSVAQSYLTSHKPDAPDSETAGKLVDALKEAKGNEAYSLTMALDGWVTPDQLPDLEKLLDSKDTTIHHQLHRVIGKIGTIEAAKVLAKELNDQQDRFSASIAIKAMGKTAEPAIIPLLASKNSDVCLEACRILQEIGTKKSVSGLQRLTKSKNLLISTTAKMALDQVRGR